MKTKSKLHQSVNVAPVASTAAKATRKSAKISVQPKIVASTVASRPAPKTAAPVANGSKTAAVIRMLGSKRGASIEELMKTTGWQSHSVRGAISGAIKKKLGLNVTSERVKDTRTYRIVK